MEFTKEAKLVMHYNECVSQYEIAPAGKIIRMYSIHDLYNMKYILRES
jgi:hypothetical protein